MHPAGRRAIVLGAGISGLTAARLLLHSGWAIEVVGRSPHGPRWVTLSRQTTQLIESIWGRGITARARHFELSARHVTWANDSPKATIFEPLLALDAASLATVMRDRLSECGTDNCGADGEPFVIDARGRASVTPTEQTCGCREMLVWACVPLMRPAGRSAEMHAGTGYWSFVFPTGPEEVCVQLATPRPQTNEMLRGVLAAEARIPGSLLAAVLDSRPDLIEMPAARISIGPRLALGSSGSRRLPVGDALMTLDPLCGDGIGHGIKSALLATAVANSAGGTVSALEALAHFECRTTAAFTAHLRHCCHYYSSIRDSAAWRPDIEATLAALNTIERDGRSAPPVYLVAGTDIRNSKAAGVRPILKRFDGLSSSIAGPSYEWAAHSARLLE